MTTFINGKKTYIVAAILIAVTIAQLFGIQVPGFETSSPGETGGLAAGLAALRAAVK